MEKEWCKYFGFELKTDTKFPINLVSKRDLQLLKIDPQEINDPNLRRELQEYQEKQLQKTIQKSVDLSHLFELKRKIKEMEMMEIQPIQELDYYKKKQAQIMLLDIYNRLQFIELNAEFPIDLIEETNLVNADNKKFSKGSLARMKAYLEKVLLNLDTLPNNYQERKSEIKQLYDEFLALQTKEISVSKTRVSENHTEEIDETVPEISPVPKIEQITFDEYRQMRIEKPVMKASNIEQAIEKWYNEREQVQDLFDVLESVFDE
ncbi:hypothetical protein HDV06_003777 [Boothiomyces sp. JEL0866]|nr:hypothetical protein HDV06_003777 [Boothiomyces sp. JEL0866]